MLTITIEEIKEIIKESPLIESYSLEDSQIDDIANDVYKLYGREAYGSR
ncbi:MAG: hypothetical protein IBX72_13715 [Nitrospirae bacterium]|nr:hypothetical protein [Nitrospirota bacterium]